MIPSPTTWCSCYTRQGKKYWFCVTTTRVPPRCCFRGPAGILLSPGPGRPESAGVCLDLLAAKPDLPILGVCLGHQSLSVAFGGQVVLAKELMHGKTSEVHHREQGLFRGMKKALHGHALPQPGGTSGEPPRRFSGRGLDRGRGSHGNASPSPALVGSAVSSRIHSDGTGGSLDSEFRRFMPTWLRRVEVSDQLKEQLSRVMGGGESSVVGSGRTIWGPHGRRPGGKPTKRLFSWLWP